MRYSRRHCAIKREETGFILHDLDSLNGTFVNGIPVKERQLNRGDLIRIGDCVFLFVTEEDETAPTSSPVQLDEQRLTAQSTIQLKLDDALYLQPERLSTSLPATARAARDLNALLKISAAINSVRDLESLQKLLLESLFETTPAQRGAILVVNENTEDFVSLYGLDRLAHSDKPIQVSRTIITQVLKNKTAY